MFDRRRSDPLLGLYLGLAMALGLTLIAVVLLLIDGPQRFEQSGVSFLEALGLYFAAGVVGGPVFGVLLPLTARRAGAALVGAIVALPAYLGAALLVGGRLSSGAIPAVIVGSVVGFALWKPMSQCDGQDDEGEPRPHGTAP